jgi:hypothetical protein
MPADPPCGASRHIEPEALARIAGRSVTLTPLAQRMRVLAVRQEGRRGDRGGEAEAARSAEEIHTDENAARR